MLEHLKHANKQVEKGNDDALNTEDDTGNKTVDQNADDAKGAGKGAIADAKSHLVRALPF